MSTAVPEWASPRTMARTYAALYNPLSWGVPVVMHETLWRLVYGDAPVRPRNKSWAHATPGSDVEREFAYTQRRRAAGERATELETQRRIKAIQVAAADATARDNDGGVGGGGGGDTSGAPSGLPLRQLLANERQNLLLTAAPLRHTFPRPPRIVTRDMPTRFFQLQHHDAHLCAIHALNNLANAVLLSPPDLLQAIEQVRPLDTLFASPEELALALLREGVFTVPLLLQMPDVLQLGDEPAGHQMPPLEHCVKLIEDAGGLVIFDGAGATGHYVALVRQPLDQADVGGLATIGPKEWCVFSTNAVVAHGYTIGTALASYMELVDSRDGLLVLLPLSLEPLLTDTERRRSKEADLSGEDSGADQTRCTVLRTLLRRSLSEMRVTESPDRVDIRDIALPRPVAPVALDALVQFVADNRASYFDGTRAVNVASVMAAGSFAEQQIGAYGREIASVIALKRDGSTSGAALRESLLASLRQLRSTMFDCHVLPLLFAMRNSFRQFERLLPGSEWLRFFALCVAPTCLIDALQGSGPESVPRRIDGALCDTLGVLVQVCSNSASPLELLTLCRAQRLPHCDTLLAFVPILEHDVAGGGTLDGSPFIALLRQTLFAMPGESIDYTLLLDYYAPPPNSQTRFGVAARQYMVERAREFCSRVHDTDFSHGLIDHMAFAVSMVDHEAPEAAAAEHRDDQPRFLERLFELGVAEAASRVYGCFWRALDSRLPIVDNCARVPLPRGDSDGAGYDDWAATQPICNSTAALCVVPLSELPPHTGTDSSGGGGANYTALGPGRRTLDAAIAALGFQADEDDDVDDKVLPAHQRRRLN
jgi:hypothetical protein